jgi:hypothetical protein
MYLPNLRWPSIMISSLYLLRMQAPWTKLSTPPPRSHTLAPAKQYPIVSLYGVQTARLDIVSPTTWRNSRKPRDDFDSIAELSLLSS